MFSVLNTNTTNTAVKKATISERLVDLKSGSESTCTSAVASCHISATRTNIIKPKTTLTAKVTKKPITSSKNKSQKSIMSFFGKTK